MAEMKADTNYPVFISKHRGLYYLCIRELFLSVRDTDLRRAYDELMNRKKEVLDWVVSLGSVDELSPPEPPSLIQQGSSQTGFIRWIWRRLVGS